MKVFQSSLVPVAQVQRKNLSNGAAAARVIDTTGSAEEEPAVSQDAASSSPS